MRTMDPEIQEILGGCSHLFLVSAATDRNPATTYPCKYCQMRATYREVLFYCAGLTVAQDGIDAHDEILTMGGTLN